MKVFQISHIYPEYISFFEQKYNISPDTSYKEILSFLKQDAYLGCHVLHPFFSKDNNNFYTLYDYKNLQLKWAVENNFDSIDLKEILIAQIEKIKPDVIYNLSTQNLDETFFKKLSIKSKVICWNADAGSIQKINLKWYNALLTSSTLALEANRNAIKFHPSTDEIMKSFSNVEKKYDIIFYGQYSHDSFKERRDYIDNLIKYCLKNKFKFKFCLIYVEKKQPLINKRYLWNISFLQKYTPPRKISKYFSKPVFGKDVYKLISEARIVFNISGGLTEFGNYKFNNRIFETLGVGSFMLSDDGVYPKYMKKGKHFDVYTNFKDLTEKIKYYLTNSEERELIAESGHKMINAFYSKEKQWENFKSIVKKI